MSDGELVPCRECGKPPVITYDHRNVLGCYDEYFCEILCPDHPFCEIAIGYSMDNFIEAQREAEDNWNYQTLNP